MSIIVSDTDLMENIFEIIHGEDNTLSTSFPLTSKLWYDVSKDSYETEKIKRLKYDAFWDLRSYARSFYDMDFMPF